jgi:hypothetical protein
VGRKLGRHPPGQYWAFLGVSLMTLPAAAAHARCIVDPPIKTTGHAPTTTPETVTAQSPPPLLTWGEYRPNFLSLVT